MLTKPEWTIDTYKVWMKERGDVGTWKAEDCRQADALVRTETLKAFKVYCDGLYPPVGSFLFAVVSVHFGSSDVDALLMELKMYPDWI